MHVRLTSYLAAITVLSTVGAVIADDIKSEARARFGGSTASGLLAANANAPAVTAPQSARELVHSFYFTRGMYSAWSRSWSTDAPDSDRWITRVIRRLTRIDASPRENYVSLADPDLRRFPFLYILEVGGMRLTDAEAQGLRNYLLSGGFVMVDDFWGSSQWANWEREIRRVLPEYPIVEIPLTHEIFSTMYLVEEVVQVPGISGVRSGITHQQDGYVAHVRGIFDERGRLMVMINWNTDLGDAWEWAEANYYSLDYSTYAYKMAANTFMYAMTH